MTSPVHDLRPAAAQAVPPARRPHPSKLFVEVTTRCNLRCAMCVKYAPGQGLIEGDMTDETYERLAPAFPHLEALVLNGIGEPLLHRGLERFVARARADMPATGWIGFQTNGQLIGERRADSLVASGVDRICISADAVSPEMLRQIHGGARQSQIVVATEALQHAAARHGRRLELGLEFVAMRSNLRELPLLVRWAADRGFAFLIVTHMLPYDASMTHEAAFAPTTDRALALFEAWRMRGAAEGISLDDYREPARFYPNDAERRANELVRGMVDDASRQGISLRIADLLAFDHGKVREVQAVFDEAATLAAERGLDLKLPRTVPTQVRRCDFVEEGSAFVSWDGKLHPCYFLWHRFACHLAGISKLVEPRVLGAVADRPLLDIWNGPEWRSLRGEVTKYEFPFCYDCNLALCDYVSEGEFEQDCHIGTVPCAACLWCTGPFQCLR
ncbi:MAG TPA: radical SAM/SPASM family putative metalloenzyme maturase [Candidatus Limnocylindrales bacterium]|nr:radical SAM/SPASM family putative metalloenzyme maturase [Candidatus Limnocylindrales bacterium]